MNPLRVLDDAILDHVFQPIANRCVSFATPRKLELFCLSGDMVLTLTVIALELQGENLGQFFNFLLGFSFVMTGIRYVIRSHMSEYLGGKTRNPERVDPLYRMLRIQDVLVSAFLIGALFIVGSFPYFLFVLSFLASLASGYFAACDRAPPSERRAKVSPWLAAQARTAK